MTDIPEIYRNNSNIVFFEPSNAPMGNGSQDVSDTTLFERINRRIGSSGESLTEILTFLLHETRSVFPCQRLSLAFLADGNERAVSHTTVADYQSVRLKTGYSEEIRNSSLEYILESGKTRIIHDLEVYQKEFPNSRSTKILLKEGVRSSLTCPLKVDDRIVGLFFRSANTPCVYTRKHVMAHQAIAERLSQVVEKAYRIEQLSTAMKSYGELLGFISHEIKSPLASIIMDCWLMLDEHLGELNPRVKDRVKRIVTRSEMLLGMVREYLDISRIEGGDLQTKFVDDVNIPDMILKPLTEMHLTAAEEKSMEFRINSSDNLPTIQCDPDLLRIAVSNLLSNAIKYGRNNTIIIIEVDSQDNQLRLSITNEGPGFSSADIPKLFKKFSRLQSPELIKQKGTGLGLYTVWRIIRLHKGVIKAKSEQGVWAKFVIDLPLRVTS